MSAAATCLSVCSSCSNEPAVHRDFGGEAATCIRCGITFLLPSAAGLATSASADDVQICPESEAAAAAAVMSSWRRPLAAGAVSVVLNGSLLFVLGLIFFHSELPEPQHTLIGQVGETSSEDIEFTPVLDPGGMDSEIESLPEVRVFSEMPAANLAVSKVGKFSLPSGVAGLGGSGAGRGVRRGTGLFAGVSDARSFAYVVDASGSMSGSRMQLVLQELARSVRALKETQKLFVVFFSDRTFPMLWPDSERDLISASGRNRERILQWAFTVRPEGGTEPQVALRQALQLHPDVVYFLTDGAVPAATVRTVKRYRRKPTIVNTICVGNDADERTMQQIAQSGEGEFVVVE